MAPSKSDKKTRSSAGGKKASAGSSRKSNGRKPTSAKAPQPRVGGDSGLRVTSSQGSRGAGKGPLAGAKLAAKASQGAKAGGKTAAGKARKVALEASKPVPERPGLAESRATAEAAIEVALDKKALMPVLIDVSAMASYTDFIAILSGKSDRQVDAISEGITQFMKGKGRTIVGHEGGGGGRWTLLDFGDIVFHVFYHPVREFYDLESLWVDAPRVALQVPPEALRIQPDMLY